MAALTAAKRDRRMRAFHDRLVANGKKPIVAIVAVMRKLIVICNALLRPEPPRPEPPRPEAAAP